MDTDTDMSVVQTGEVLGPLKGLVYLCMRTRGVPETLQKLEEVLESSPKIQREERDPAMLSLKEALKPQGFSWAKVVSWADAEDDDDEEQ